MKAESEQKFFKKAQSLGYDNAEALTALGVKNITDFHGNIGQALNTLIQFRKSRTTQTALVALPEHEHRSLYSSSALFQFGQALRSFAPWANNENYRVSDIEIALVVQRGDKAGLDVLNPHEVQIFKDRTGVKFQLAYTLITQWSEQLLGGHTAPRYLALNDDEKIEAGIPISDKAVRCEFVMLSDIPTIKIMVDAGWDAQEARSDLTMRGLGMVSASDWGSKYFAPNGRAKMWKLEKRAYTDAIRKRYGTPSSADILKMRRLRNEAELTTADWEIAQDEQSPDARVSLAQMSANGAMNPVEAPEETLAHNRSILHGDPEDADWDAPVAKDKAQVDTKMGEGKVLDDGLTDIQCKAFEFVTPEGQRLGDATPEQLKEMQKWVDENPKKKGASELGGHVVVMLAYQAQFEVKADD